MGCASSVVSPDPSNGKDMSSLVPVPSSGTNKLNQVRPMNTISPHIKGQDPTSPSTPTESFPAVHLSQLQSQNNQVQQQVGGTENFSSGLIYTEATSKGNSVNDISNLFSSIKRGNYQHFVDIIQETYKQCEKDYHQVHYVKGMWDSTPLVVAIQYHQLEMIDYLLKHLPLSKVEDGTSSSSHDVSILNHRNEKGATAILFAVMEGLTDIVKKLIELKVDVIISHTNDAIYNPLYDQSMIATPLSLAVVNQHVDILKVLLQAGCSVNTIFTFPTVKSTATSNGKPSSIGGVKGLTPILLACYYGHLDVVKELLSHEDCDCEANDEEFANALHHLARSKAKVLPAKEGNNDESPLNPIVGIFQELMRKEVITMEMLQQRDKNNDTALHIACDNKQVELVKLLLEEGSNASSMNSNTNFTPLHIAIRRRQADLVKLLLEYGADPTAKNESKANAQSPIEMSNKLSSDNEIYIMMKQAMEARTESSVKAKSNPVKKSDSPLATTTLKSSSVDKGDASSNNQLSELTIASSKITSSSKKLLLLEKLSPETVVVESPCVEADNNIIVASPVIIATESSTITSANKTENKKKGRSTLVSTSIKTKQASPIPTTTTEQKKVRSVRSTIVASSSPSSNSPSKKESFDPKSSTTKTQESKKGLSNKSTVIAISTTSTESRDVPDVNQVDQIVSTSVANNPLIDISNNLDMCLTGEAIKLVPALVVTTNTSDMTNKYMASEQTSVSVTELVSPRKDPIATYMEMQIVPPTNNVHGTPAVVKVHDHSKSIEKLKTVLKDDAETSDVVESKKVAPEDGTVTDFSILPNEEESFDLLLMKMLSTGQGDEQLEEYLKDHTNDYSSMLAEEEGMEGNNEEKDVNESMIAYKEQDMTMLDFSIIHDNHHDLYVDAKKAIIQPSKPKEVFILQPTNKPTTTTGVVPEADSISVNSNSPKKGKGNKSPRSTSSKVSSSSTKKKTEDKAAALGISSKVTKSKTSKNAEDSTITTIKEAPSWNDSTVVSSNTPTKVSTTIKTSQTTGKKKTASSVQREALQREGSTRLQVANNEEIVGIAGLENMTALNTSVLGSMTGVKAVSKPPINGESRNAAKKRGLSGKLNSDGSSVKMSAALAEKNVRGAKPDENAIVNSQATNKSNLSLDMELIDAINTVAEDLTGLPNGLSTPKASRVKGDKEDDNRGTESVPLTPIGMLVSNVAHQSPIVSVKNRLTAGIAAVTSPVVKQKTVKVDSKSNNSAATADKSGSKPRRKVAETPAK